MGAHAFEELEKKSEREGTELPIPFVGVGCGKPDYGAGVKDGKAARANVLPRYFTMTPLIPLTGKAFEVSSPGFLSSRMPEPNTMLREPTS